MEGKKSTKTFRWYLHGGSTFVCSDKDGSLVFKRKYGASETFTPSDRKAKDRNHPNQHLLNGWGLSAYKY